MRIAMVYPLPMPVGRNKPKYHGGVSVGGGETYPFMLSKALSDMGNEVTYFTGKIEGIVDDEINVGNLRVVYCPINSMWGNMVHHALSLKLFLKLLYEDYDIYVSWQAPTIFSVITGLVAKIRNKPFVVSHIGLRPEMSRSARLYTRIVSKMANKIIIPNRFSKKFFDPYFSGNKMVFLQYGINLKRFERVVDRNLERRYKKKGEKIVLYVGRLVPNKGVDDLIDAISIISKKDSRVKLIIIGSGDRRIEKYLRECVKESGIDDRVVFNGPVVEKLPKFYSMADVTVLPSVYRNRFGTYYPEPEAFGLVLAESMSCGTPVVATKVGGVPYWIKNGYNGLLCKPSNPSNLASAISKILHSKKLSARLVKNAKRELNEKYSLEKVARRFMKILEREL
jgi:glycosyltransferase involved in cell wall biosynthesis